MRGSAEGRCHTVIVASAYASRSPSCRLPMTMFSTVERVRYVPVYHTTCGGCAPAPQRAVYQAAYTSCGGCAPAVAAPTYYAPTYYAPRYYR